MSRTSFSRRRFGRVVAVAAAAALALGGCARTGTAIVPAPGVTPAAKCGTVRIMVNNWVGYEADFAVVGYLARTRLGCTVVAVREDEVPSWKDLAAGRVDAILENWGHDDLRKAYIDEQKVAVEAGLTGNRGVIGWYVPPWMAEKYPGITDYRNLNTYAKLFRTARSGEKGEFVDGDPSYVTNDAALIANLKLNYAVSYAGSEAKLIARFQDAQAHRKPLIGYFYSPQWLLSEINLNHIALPAYTPGCDTDPKTITCDYQPYDLDKIESRRFARSGSPAATLVTNFRWTNADQNQVARDITEGKLSDDQAAEKWLAAHRSTWEPWLAGTPAAAPAS